MKNYVVCDAYARVLTQSGAFASEFPEAKIFGSAGNAKAAARKAAKVINDETCAIEDYGLESQRVVARFNGNGHQIGEAHYTYGSGMSGCLYDSGPHFAENLKKAIDGALFTFDELPEDELQSARDDLESSGIHYFADPKEAGADFVEITRCDCDSPEDHQEEP